MMVERVLSFAQYRRSVRLRGRRDNIYRPVKNNGTKGYKQIPNLWHKHSNMKRDLSVDRVLLSGEFVYFGEKVPVIPVRFQQFVKKGRGHLIGGKNEAERRRISALRRWAFHRAKGKFGKPADKPRPHTDCS